MEIAFAIGRFFVVFQLFVINTPNELVVVGLFVGVAISEYRGFEAFSGIFLFSHIRVAHGMALLYFYLTDQADPTDCS